LQLNSRFGVLTGLLTKQNIGKEDIGRYSSMYLPHLHKFPSSNSILITLIDSKDKQERGICKTTCYFSIK